MEPRAGSETNRIGLATRERRQPGDFADPLNEAAAASTSRLPSTDGFESARNDDIDLVRRWQGDSIISRQRRRASGRGQSSVTVSCDSIVCDRQPSNLRLATDHTTVLQNA